MISTSLLRIQLLLVVAGYSLYSAFQFSLMMGSISSWSMSVSPRDISNINIITNTPPSTNLDKDGDDNEDENNNEDEDNNEDNNDNEDKDKSTNHEVGSEKPLEAEPKTLQQRPIKFFAIHIGPSKTGSSAIQTDFTRNPFDVNTLGEDKDNLIYVGKRLGKGRNDPGTGTEIRNVGGKSMTGVKERKMHMRAMRCMIEKLEEYYESSSSDRDVINKSLETDEEARVFLRQQFIDNCYTDHEYMLNYSIVDSSEGYSYNHVYKRVKSEFQIFDILGYERLIVVGAYRRYADWIVSAYTQHIKNPYLLPNLDGKNMPVPCVGIGDFLRKNQKNSTEYSTLFYATIDKTLPTIVEAGPSKLEAKILNFFQLPYPSNESGVKSFNSITTELYCDAFGMELTPHTCNHARDIAKDNTTSSIPAGLVANKGSTSNAVYQQITAAGHRLGFILPTDKQLKAEGKCGNKSTTRKQRKKQSVELFRCDADTKCYDDTKRNRELCTRTESALRNELHKCTSGGKTSIIGTNSTNIRTYEDLSDYHTKMHGLSWTESLPIQCLRKKELDLLLQMSLEYEQSVMPEFYATPLGKDEHIRLFWDVWLEEKKLFCWVDINRLFQDATSWDEIINERMVSYDWAATNKTRGL